MILPASLRIRLTVPSRLTTQAIRGASEEMQAKGILLRTSVEPTTRYLAFNMLDATVGGNTPGTAETPFKRSRSF